MLQVDVNKPVIYQGILPEIIAKFAKIKEGASTHLTGGAFYLPQAN
jgi:hypothetical protein